MSARSSWTAWSLLTEELEHSDAYGMAEGTEQLGLGLVQRDSHAPPFRTRTVADMQTHATIDHERWRETHDFTGEMCL